MEVKAKVKHIRMSPRKVRLVVDVVRGLEVEKAIDQLDFMNKKAVTPVKKLLESAIANAENNFDLEKNNLFIKEIRVDESRTLKRWMPRARGRATPIRKRMSHINLILGELVDSGEKEGKKPEVEEPVKLGSQPKSDEGVKVKGKKDNDKEENKADEKENDKKIVDPRAEGHGKNTKIEGNAKKGFAGKMFRRKSG